ncbi:hypothetical protein [Caballeronia sp. BCC1704]|uniref:hypothetical protein n=1 Tax=Caballeronia sp. BCC1704 TaxID=2676300 RepID=UPI00158BA710|nr:hypothetical protein [Caballeronia sp. BCC1704]
MTIQANDIRIFTPADGARLAKRSTAPLLQAGPPRSAGMAHRRLMQERSGDYEKSNFRSRLVSFDTTGEIYLLHRQYEAAKNEIMRKMFAEDRRIAPGAWQAAAEPGFSSLETLEAWVVFRAGGQPIELRLLCAVAASEFDSLSMFEEALPRLAIERAPFFPARWTANPKAAALDRFVMPLLEKLGLTGKGRALRESEALAQIFAVEGGLLGAVCAPAARRVAGRRL